MKFKITRKEAREQARKLFKLGYSRAQYLLMTKSPFAYSTRVEGWACDYYDLGDGVIICTGYAPTGKELDYNLVKEFEDAALKIECNYNISWDEKQIAIDNLIEEFKKAIDK